MTSLFLLRHAKSSWADPALADRDRPLTARGERAARRIAAYMASQEICPDLVLCSPAVRTRSTLDLIRPVLGPGAAVLVEDALYGAGATELVRRLRAIDAGVASVMIIGHNPGLEDLAWDLAGEGEGDEAAVEQLRTKFPTAALACFDVAAPWARVGPGQVFLTRLVLPRRLPD